MRAHGGDFFRSSPPWLPPPQPDGNIVESMVNSILARLKSVDWMDKPEAKISSELITPLLRALGYGEHTLHRVREQQTFTLRDPMVSKGVRRVRLDYQPTIYAEGLWVMEAKGTKGKVRRATLGQVRDYSIHPEVRAALMVTVDAAGFRIFDPWDKHWDEPLVTIGINEIGNRFDELRAVLGTDHVAEVIRRRHLDHLRRALSASLEFGVLDDAESEFKSLLSEVRQTIDEKRREIHRRAHEEYEELHDRVLRNSGVWGVAQHNNDPWIGTIRETRDYAAAVLHQPEAQRRKEILRVWEAIEAVYRTRCPEGASLRRPLWWLHTVLLGGCLALRGEPGCDPLATEFARQEIRNHLLGFPDDPVEAASWRLQRVLIPLLCRIASFAPLDKLSAGAKSRMSAEDRIRYRMDPSWFLIMSVRNAAIRWLGQVEPWTADRLDEEAEQIAKQLERTPVPGTGWVGPVGDPWLQSWQTVDPLLMCGLAVLVEDESGDELLRSADELLNVVRSAAASEHELLRRPAVPLAQRLGLQAD